MGSDALDEYWAAYCRATGSRLARPGVVCFGESPAQQDELCGLVLAGVKRAACSLARRYGPGREAVPQPGDLAIMLDGQGRPRGVIRIDAVFEQVFADVGADFAAAEGEGDGSLADWQAEHRRFFAAELAAEGVAFSPEMHVICECFTLVWR